MDDEEHAVQPLAGGIAQHGYQCGMIWGSALAAGAEVHRRLGSGPEAETRAIVAARRLFDAFLAQNRHTDCFDITGLDERASTRKMIAVFLLKGQTIGCLRMAARYAPIARREIESAVSEPAEAPPAAASCAAILARRMGASEQQSVMAAGLAGGIGLSGGACGALGAAIWVQGLKAQEEGEKVPFKSPRALDTVGKFLRCTGYEFECARIVGRKFESVGDHASYLRGGGCAKVLEVLAAA